MLVAAQLAGALQAALAALLDRFTLYLPSLLVALAVLLCGVLAARALSRLVREAAEQAGFDNSALMGTAVRHAIAGGALLVALGEAGVATALVTTLFAGLVGCFALAVGLAFGLGGRDVAAQVWRTWYARAQDLEPQLEAAARPAFGSEPRPPAGPVPARPPAGPRTAETAARARVRHPGEGWRSGH